MFDELSSECIEASRSLLQRCLAATGRELDDAEVFYLAVHFEAAKYTDGA
jgi:hypothetical protein